MSRFVVFDMDDVVVNLREVLCQALNSRTGKNIPWEQWHTWELPDLYEDKMETLLKYMQEEEVLERAILDPSAMGVFHSLRQSDVQVAVLTSRGWHPNGVNLTMDYFERHNLEIDDLCVVKHGQKKSDALHRYGQVVRFVDDYHRNVEDMVANGIPSLLMDRPWNRLETRFERVFSLDEAHDNIQLELSGTNQGFSIR